MVGYLLGSIPFGYLIVRWRKGIDVRTTGSKSIGATNVWRNLGLAGFLATFFLDAGKGLVSVLLASSLSGDDPRSMAAAGVAAILGHIFPVWLAFRGGKGVATSVGVFSVLAPAPMAVSIALFVLVFAMWGYVSLASIASTAFFPAAAYVMDQTPTAIILAAVVVGALVIVKHRSNIGRLLSGTESRMAWKAMKLR
jgi:glycerol-3-phosphate acyltransferase PlsY